MTNWNVPKIREECLELLGWKQCLRPDGVPNGDWIDPNGMVCNEEYRCDCSDRVPNPVYSLDDALPLIEKYKMSLHAKGASFANGEYTSDDEHWTAEARVSGDDYDVKNEWADTAPLAICLVALLCAGHNLDDFKLAGEA